MTEDLQLDWLSRWHMYAPQKVAITDGATQRRYTYKDFYQISNGLVPFLRSLGVEKGDRVAVLSENKVETVFLFFALQRMGAILVPINFRFSPSEVSYVLQDSGAKVLFHNCESENSHDGFSEYKVTPILKTMSELSSQVSMAESYEQIHDFVGEFTDPCQILYTSGTTGFPKGVVITHEILFWNSINTSLSLNLSSSDSMVSFLPLFHVGGWNVLLTPLIHRGGSIFFLEKFDASKVLEVCEKGQVSILFGVPTTLAMMAKEVDFANRDFTSMRFAVVGGEPMPLKLIQTWHEKGVPVRQGFGLTECGPNCFSLSAEDAESRLGSIGRPNFYVETRIVDEDDNVLNEDEVGELLLRGPMCMKEYWQNEEATHSSISPEGWLRTGDLVKKDSEGYFYVVGRKKEMFISGGENVYPAEVERVLGTHPEVDEVAVLGVDDETWGEVGKAFVVPKRSDASLTKQDIDRFCSDKLAKYKVPKHYVFIESLPKGSTGKILKQNLATHNV